MNIIQDPTRWALALIAVLIYAVVYRVFYVAALRKQALNAQRDTDAIKNSKWIVAYASQTGTAEDIAQQTVHTLHVGGVEARVCSLLQLNVEQLQDAERILFVVSTYGEGDPPDDAAVFASRLMSTQPVLDHLHYAVLALGDSTYSQYCGFGRSLDEWLKEQSAQPMFERIDVDQCNAAALDEWRKQLSHLAGTSDAADWSGPSFGDWRLTERRLLNPDSAGEAVYHLEFEPVDSVLPDWQSGDLAQILAPVLSEKNDTRPREYSISSIHSDGRIYLLMRLHRHTDGSTGLVSGWLGEQANIGDPV